MNGRKSKGKMRRWRDPRLLTELNQQVKLYRISHGEIGREAGVCRSFVTHALGGRRHMTEGVVRAIRRVVRRRCKEIMAAEMRSLR